MSHFAVAVLSDGTKTLEELLAPYQEDDGETIPRWLLEFRDTAAQDFGSRLVRPQVAGIPRQQEAPLSGLRVLDRRHHIVVD